ncbi:MAG: hypothetical protein GEU26_14070 [Nitrososphaeraceae archaeon]|nr:hypothetical protein [Nitrososphaeraceae archaeon]
MASTFTELQEIYNQYGKLLSVQPQREDPTISRAASTPVGSANIFYAWYPQTIEREKFSVLMLKFTNRASQKSADKIDYDILITADNTKDRFKIGKSGTSLAGVGNDSD